MVEVVITYETLYEILRREKGRAELQKLDDNFFKNVVDYLNEKQDFINSRKGKSTIFDGELNRIKKEINSIKRILKEIYEKREIKIIEMALAKAISGNKEGVESMLLEERWLYDMLFDYLTDFRENVLQNLLMGIIPKKPKLIKSEKVDDFDVNPKPADKLLAENSQESNGTAVSGESEQNGNTMTVRFLEAVPKFFGIDGYVYGPFENDDLAELPSEVVRLLLKNKRVEKV